MFGLALTDLKPYLGYAADDTSRDVQLQLLLDAGCEELKRQLGRNLELKSYRDTLQFSGHKMHLLEWPVVSVTDVTVGDGLVDAANYDVFKDAGLVVFKYSSWLTPCYPNTVVNYVAGYTTLPADLKLALFNAIQRVDTVNKQTSSFGGVAKRLSVYDVGIADLAVPKDGLSSSIADSLGAELIDRYGAHRAVAGPLVHESEVVGDAP